VLAVESHTVGRVRRHPQEVGLMHRLHIDARASMISDHLSSTRQPATM
jgi:hypothetical protein